MSAHPSRWRAIPLKVAGTIGLVAALVYLAGVLGQDDVTFLPQAIFWFSVMVLAGAFAWLADRSAHRGRPMAIGSGITFFVLALVSNVIFMIAFLLAVVLVVVGLSTTWPREQRAGDQDE